MSQEFEFPEYDQSQPIIEILHSPLREDERHRILFGQVKFGFGQAEQNIKANWWQLLRGELMESFLKAEITKQPQEVSINRRGANRKYVLELLGLRSDQFQQNGYVFRLVEADVVNTPDTAEFITVALERNEKTSFDRLIALVVENAGADITKHQFHFVKGQLRSLYQVSQTGALFPNHYDNDRHQFLSLALGATKDKTPVLGLSAGNEGADKDEIHYYKNYSGNIFEMQNLRIRIIDGEVELIWTKGKQFYVSSPFLIPEAIANMANFEPATA